MSRNAQWNWACRYLLRLFGVFVPKVVRQFRISLSSELLMSAILSIWHLQFRCAVGCIRHLVYAVVTKVVLGPYALLERIRRRWCAHVYTEVSMRIKRLVRVLSVRRKPTHRERRRLSPRTFDFRGIVQEKKGQLKRKRKTNMKLFCLRCRGFLWKSKKIRIVVSVLFTNRYDLFE